MPHRAESLIAGGAAASLWLALAAPPARELLESSMQLHMLVQLPLLALAGFTLGAAWRGTQDSVGRAGRILRATQRCNAAGATGVVAVGFVMVMWMLPRSLDLARLDQAVNAAKFISVMGAGVAVALSWPRLPLIARGVIHLELIATLFRFGWGYVATEERLCLTYLAGDQQRTGTLLLWVGAAYALVAAWGPLFGTWERTAVNRGSVNDAPM